MTDLNGYEVRELLTNFDRLEKGINVIAKEKRPEKLKEYVELFTEIVNNCRTRVDKHDKILSGMMMEKIMDGEGSK
jgi:hypothetical protein